MYSPPLRAAYAVLAKSQSDSHGNVSERRENIVWIKPSGMKYSELVASDNSLAAVDVESGAQLDLQSTQVYDRFAGRTEILPRLSPSVDLAHHLSIYRRHPWIGGICHSHTPYVVAHAIVGRPVLCLSTEQSDIFGGPVRVLPYADFDSWGDEVSVTEGERAVLLSRHGGLSFGKDAREAADLAVFLEGIAEKNFLAESISGVRPLDDEAVSKWRKRYEEKYGQK